MLILYLGGIFVFILPCALQGMDLSHALELGLVVAHGGLAVPERLAARCTCQWLKGEVQVTFQERVARLGYLLKQPRGGFKLNPDNIQVVFMGGMNIGYIVHKFLPGMVLNKTVMRGAATVDYSILSYGGPLGDVTEKSIKEETIKV